MNKELIEIKVSALPHPCFITLSKRKNAKVYLVTKIMLLDSGRILLIMHDCGQLEMEKQKVVFKVEYKSSHNSENQLTTDMNDLPF